MVTFEKAAVAASLKTEQFRTLVCDINLNFHLCVVCGGRREKKVNDGKRKTLVWWSLTQWSTFFLTLNAVVPLPGVYIYSSLRQAPFCVQ